MGHSICHLSGVKFAVRIAEAWSVIPERDEGMGITWLLSWTRRSKEWQMRGGNEIPGDRWRLWVGFGTWDGSWNKMDGTTPWQNILS